MQIQPYGPPACQALVHAMLEVARTKDEPADFINVALEEFVHQRFELAAFGTLIERLMRD